MVNENIKIFRERKNFTQAELADKLCVTRQAVSNWENGKTEPDIDMLNKIASVLEVSVEELIYGFKRDTKIVHNHNTTQHITKNITKPCHRMYHKPFTNPLNYYSPWLFCTIRFTTACRSSGLWNSIGETLLSKRTESASINATYLPFTFARWIFSP